MYSQTQETSGKYKNIVFSISYPDTCFVITGFISVDQKIIECERTHWTIYSATTFLESCRKLIREKCFEKSGSRNLVREKWLTRKKGGFIL